MKKTYLFIVTLLLAVTTSSRAQNPVVDKYPDAAIYIIDPQSGQEVLAQDDNAILFKDAFIDLVNNTYRVKHIIKSPGHKSIVITQTDPADGNAFQLVNQSKFLGSEIANYTFSYSVDQNTLYYLDPVSQTWQPEVVQGYNVVNMNNCLALGKFNELQVADANDNNNTDVQQSGNDNSDEDVTADTPPPALQDYEQPECPEDGYLWQPGYWAFNPGGGYYWVPGVWVAPPSENLLWTPPYWGYEGNVYVFHTGYWGPHVGFYGGINYGYGYAGDGYYGGNWDRGHFRYNTAVVRVNDTRVYNVYVDRTVVHVGVRVNKVSFNGPGGATNRPTQREIGFNNENHIRDHHQDPKAANGVNTYHNNNGGNNQGNNGYRNGNNPRNNNQSGSNNANTNNAGNGNLSGGNNGGRNGNVYVPRNGSAPTNNNNSRNGNTYVPRNSNNPTGASQNTTNSPRNGNNPNTPTGNSNRPAVPTNGPGGHNANPQGAPRTPGNGPSVPRGPGGHNGNGNNGNGNGGNNSPRNGNGGNGKSGGNNGGNKSKKDDKKGN